MDDKEIMAQIGDLIQTEHKLREQLAAGELSGAQERERLRSAEEALDQCWDLLRQRRARREFGEDPDQAAARPVSEVESYQQLAMARGYAGRVRGSGGTCRSAYGGQAGARGRGKEWRAYREIRQG